MAKRKKDKQANIDQQNIAQKTKDPATRTSLTNRGLLLKRKLLNQGFLMVMLNSSRWTFYGRHRYLVNRYGIFVLHMTTDMFCSS
jgi:hypothetical protein